MPALPIIDGGNVVEYFDRVDRHDLWLVDNLFNPRSPADAVAEGVPGKGTVLTVSTPNGDRDCVVRQLTCLVTLTSIATFTEIWQTYATSYFGGSLGPRRSSYTSTEFEIIDIPNWTSHIPAAGPPYWVAVPPGTITATRVGVTRYRTYQTSGYTEDDICTYDGFNAGKIRTISGGSWQYMGSTLSTGADNQQRIVVRYRSKSALPGITAGTYGGCDVTVPPLPTLAEYVPQFTEPDETPTVAVALPIPTYGEMTSPPPWDP